MIFSLENRPIYSWKPKIMQFWAAWKRQTRSNDGKKRSNQGWVGRVNFDQPRIVQVAELMRMLPSSMNSGDGEGRIDQTPHDVIGWLRGSGSSV